MKANIPPLFPEQYYHIYNRGINGEDIFKQEKNYFYFLEKYTKHVEPIARTYAYCLLKNHFHLVVCIKTEKEIRNHFPQKAHSSIDKLVSQQFSHLFNGYAQGINKTYFRTGGLFETPFRRIHIDDEAYFTQALFYVHANPQKHGFIKDFRAYPHSSYSIYESRKPTKLMREAGLDWFGGEDAFRKFHRQDHLIHKEDEKIAIEFD